MKPSVLPHVVMALMALGAVAGAETMLDTAFGVGHAPVTVFDRRDPETRVSGSLPAGWRDNSSWAWVWAVYTPREEQGRTFLRAEVTRLENGLAAICYTPLPDLTEENYFRLTIALRSPGRVPVQLLLRFAGKPYTALWQTMLYPGADWEERTFIFPEFCV